MNKKMFISILALEFLVSGIFLGCALNSSFNRSVVYTIIFSAGFAIFFADAIYGIKKYREGRITNV